MCRAIVGRKTGSIHAFLSSVVMVYHGSFSLSCKALKISNCCWAVRSSQRLSMSMSVGVEMGVPGVIKGPSDALAVAATAIDRHPKLAALMFAAAACREQASRCWGLDAWSSGRGASRRDAWSEERSIVCWLRRRTMDAICPSQTIVWSSSVLAGIGAA